MIQEIDAHNHELVIKKKLSYLVFHLKEYVSLQHILEPKYSFYCFNFGGIKFFGYQEN